MLLLHGLPASHVMWRTQFRALAAEFRVIAPDLPGQGASPAPAEPPSLAYSAARVADLLERLELPAVHFVGFSAGGYIALELLRTRPELARSVTLADTRASADGPDERAGRLARADALAQSGATMDEMVRNFAPGVLSPAVPDAVLAEVRSWVAANEPADIAWVLRSVAARTDSFDVLAALTVPTLIVVGEHDGVTTPAEAERMRAARGAADLATIAHAGHLSNVEQPAQFNETLLRFLRTTTR